jgi:hypothetical protein
MAGKKKARLPAEYQEVKYITIPEGGQINTGRIWPTNAGVSYNCDAQINSAFSNNRCVFGAISNNAIIQTVVNTDAQNYIQQNATNIYGGTIPRDNNRHLFTMTPTGGYIDGQLNYASTQGTAPTAFICIAMLNNGRRTTNLTLWEYWGERNGIRVQDLIPCYRKADMAAGVYDIINNTFIGNSGTGTIEKGPNV